MNVAKWAGVFAAVLALGCAGQQAETRTSGAAARGSATGGGDPESTASNEQAPSQQPSAGAGTKNPHPVATNPDDPAYGGSDRAQSGAVARPGLEGRPGVQRETDRADTSATGSTATSSTAAGDVEELDEVYGQVTEVGKDEIEIEPAYGDPIKLKLNEQSMAGTKRATTDMLSEGDEVRASYDADEKVAVDLKTGDDAMPIDTFKAPDSAAPMKSEPPSTTGDTSSGATTR